MNNVFKLISTILMIILILILVWVLVNYYKADPYTTAPSYSDNTKSTLVVPTQDAVYQENVKDDGIQTIDNSSNVENEDKIESDQNDNNTDIADSNSDSTLPFWKRNEPGKSNDTVVISSSEKTSNTEKQEVLNEIDKALMDLLQVVDKVQTVDESRLGVEESEVQ